MFGYVSTHIEQENFSTKAEKERSRSVPSYPYIFRPISLPCSIIDCDLCSFLILSLLDAHQQTDNTINLFSASVFH